MARLPRFYAPGVPLHVIQRGNNRQAVFRHPLDRSFFRNQLARFATRHAVAIHSYVFMDNHVHLLVTPGNPNAVPKMMQALGRVYVGWFNDRYQRTGTLWEGRYKASIVESEQYLIACMRYIELNPVRAGVVGAPDEFRWSSFRANALGLPDDLVRPHPVYLDLATTSQDRAANYREFFRNAISDAVLEEIRDATQNAWAIGGESFKANICRVSRRPTRAPMGRPKK